MKDGSCHTHVAEFRFDRKSFFRINNFGNFNHSIVILCFDSIFLILNMKSATFSAEIVFVSQITIMYCYVVIFVYHDVGAKQGDEI